MLLHVWMKVSTQANASANELYRGWVSRLAIFGKINVCVMPKKKNRKKTKDPTCPSSSPPKKPTTKKNPNKYICFEIFWIGFHLHLVKFIALEINCFMFNVQHFSKKLWKFTFNFFFYNNNIFAVIIVIVVYLDWRKIYHDRRNKLAV